MVCALLDIASRAPVSGPHVQVTVFGANIRCPPL